MDKIREYGFDALTILGYYDEESHTTYGYPKEFPSKFTSYVGAPNEFIEIEDERVIDFISKNLVVYLNFKRREEETKGEKYEDIIIYLASKAREFYRLVDTIVSEYGVSDSVDYELRNLDLAEVSIMTADLRKMVELTGTMDNFEEYFPALLFFELYGSNVSIEDYYNELFPAHFISWDPKHDSICVSIDKTLTLAEYILWVRTNKLTGLMEYKETYENQFSTLEILFKIPASKDLEVVEENMNLLTLVFAYINEFEESLKDKR